MHPINAGDQEQSSEVSLKLWC